nr:ribonuclease H-like domain-containing protein [Tanacetum cinerariifolium]
MRPNINAAQPNRTSFYKPAHSYTKRPFQRISAVRSQYSGPRVPLVSRKFSNVNRLFPTANKIFPTGSTKFSTADMGKKRKAATYPTFVIMSHLMEDMCLLVKEDARLLANELSKPGSSQNNIDDKGYWDSGCSRHMTGNISYLCNYEPFDGGYVSFECIVLGRNFKLSDDANVLVRTPRQHTVYSIDLNNIVPHKDLTCLVAKAFADECMLWHRRLGHLNFKTMNRFTWTFFLKTKDETSGILRKFITEIENLKDLKVKIIRCDNGGEFRNKEMDEFCSQKGIKREFSNARTPQQNGVDERRNRTLIEAARTMLADAKFLVQILLTFQVQRMQQVKK